MATKQAARISDTRSVEPGADPMTSRGAGEAHTPLPWKYNRTHGLSSDTWYVITDADGYGPVVEVGGNDISGQVAEAKHLVTNPATVEANAQLIVQAVNSHAELMEALNDVYEILEWLGQSGNLKSPIEPHPYGLGVIEAKQKARAALSKARGGK